MQNLGKQIGEKDFQQIIFLKCKTLSCAGQFWPKLFLEPSAGTVLEFFENLQQIMKKSKKKFGEPLHFGGHFLTFVQNFVPSKIAYILYIVFFSIVSIVCILLQ